VKSVKDKYILVFKTIMNFKETVGRSFKTISEMLLDRKFLKEDEEDILKSLSNNELSTFAQKQIFCIDIGTKVRIIYYLQQFRINDLKVYVEKGDFELYLVVYKKLTTNNIKSIHDMEKKIEQPITLQLFDIKEVLFNITKHVLVPKHEVITDEEVITTIIKEHNVKNRHHFPLILKTDPIAKYYGMKPGNLVKITRVSPSSGEYFIYRCVV
jgi:DNA-directed RNA polymerase subunit H (RpoH/RPB5)